MVLSNMLPFSKQKYILFNLLVFCVLVSFPAIWHRNYKCALRLGVVGQNASVPL